MSLDLYNANLISIFLLALLLLLSYYNIQNLRKKNSSNFNKFFHANSRVNYLKSINRDFKKLEWLEQNDYNLIEINHDEVDLLSKDFFKNKFKVDL